MAESFLNLEDEVLPSFLSSSLDSTSGRATLGNVTLGSGPGLPVAASTVAKIRVGTDNRVNTDASYLEGGQLSLTTLQASNTEQAKFALSFKDDLGNMEDFIAAHRFSDMLVKVTLAETGSKTQGTVLPPKKPDLVLGRPTDLGADLSTGLLSFSQFRHKDVTNAKALCLSAPTNEDSPDSEGADSDRFSGSVSSFLANEKLMSVDSMNSDLTDDDLDMNNMPDDELELYFNKLIPPAMQRGRVEGQELPTAGLPGVSDSTSNPSSTEPEKHRQFLDDYEQEDFQMPDVRLAATGMDSCPASDEDTEDELEAARRHNSATRTRLLLPSTSRQLVGESHRPSFRPGLEGGSSDDEPFSGRSGPSQSGIEHRCSAEGQVINPPVTGDGGDGSSGSEESGNDGGVSTIPVLAQSSSQTTYDVLRGLGIVGSSGVGQDMHSGANGLLAFGRNGLPRHTEMGDRVGPVGTGEATGGPQRLSPVNWSMTLDRQEALDAMDSTQSVPAVEAALDSVYLRNGAGHWRPQDSASHLQVTQSSFHLSQMVPPDDDDDGGGGVDEVDGARPSLGLRGGPCGNATVAKGTSSTDGTSEDDNNLMSTSLEPKYFSPGFLPEQEDSDDAWSNCPNNMELEFQQGATQSVVYQNEEGKWVTDLAYYSSFEKEVDGNIPEDAGQPEDFVPACNAIEKIIEDQEEFEKEHQFMQEEQIEAARVSQSMADSWKLPTSSHILMRASQVSSEFQRANQSYLRLSLGEFFSQRSEALGCLGNDEMDWVKRPSFGYVITSPEKREPFALIRPSDFASQNASVHNTVELDRTLTQDELDETLDAPVDRMSPKGDADSEPSEKEDKFNPGAPLQPSSGDDPDLANHSADSPHNTTNLMLSISTIASAIADASISSDPSQLAAMIMELSKQSRAKNRSDAAKPMGAAASGTDEQTPVQHSDSEVDQSALLNPLQRSTCAGELSVFDIEKYLRKADVSGASDTSIAHMTLDLTSLADHLKNTQHGLPADARSISAQPVEDGTRHSVKADEAADNSAASHKSLSRSNSNNKGDSSRRSCIPRPKASGILTQASSSRRSSVGSGQPSTVKPPANGKTSLQASQKGEHSSAASPSGPGTSSVLRKGRSGLPCLKGSSPPTQRAKGTGRQHGNTPEKGGAPSSPVAAPQSHNSTGKHVGFSCQSPQPPAHRTFEVFKSSSEPPAGDVEETQCNFRPSTSPLTHSSPSQTSFPSADSTVSSPSSCGGPADRRPGCELSPQSACSSPSLSRLTYISINDCTVAPTPQKQKSDLTMALSTTIIRASPTPPVEPDSQSNFEHLGPSKTLEQLHQSKSLDPLPPHRCRSPGRSCSSLSCTRSQSERAYPQCGGGVSPGPADRPGQACLRQLSKVDSGYSSNLNIQQQQHSSNAAFQSTQHWGTSGSGPAPAQASCPGGAVAMPPPYSSEELRYVPISSFKPQADGPHHHGGLLSGHSLFTAQLAQARQYLGSDAALHPGPYHLGAANHFYTVSASALSNGEPSVRHLHTSTGAPGVLGPGGFHPLHRPHQNPLDLAMMGMGKPYNGVEPWAPTGLDEIRGHVVVPEELRFPHACCVGIASQTSLSLFNPSERWQQVSITVSGLAIDGEKVDSLPYQWLMVKNKTIIGPRSTEEQKVLLIPPQAGVYQCVLSVSSWPASAGPDLAARAEVFARRVLLVAMAENPAIEVDVGKSGCLDFGDLSGGSAKSLALKLLNRTHATVPIRLVISANATAWRCFTFSKNPVAMTAEGALQAGHVTQLSSPSVMNHIMHASYGENPESFMVWVHFRAPQKYTSSSGDLGAADEYNARVDIEVDCPGPSQVIRSINLKARSGTARVHAPKDLQTVSLSAALGKSSQQTLPLKNAGNIDVELKLKISDTEGCFMVRPDELSLRAGDEECIVVTFSAQSGKKCRESLLAILVLPSGPQYEVALKGEVIPELCGKAAPLTSATSVATRIASDVPPILSNKQFVAWGGVTLGRAVQQKLVLRNNSANTTQHLRLLIRGQDQDCFQLQSMFSPEERLTRHGELSIRPLEDVAVHLLFAPTRVACMLAKLEIKQSGVRPSQPGVKFTIPLSGYGGTSNIILEDQRKQAGGYVAVLAGIAVGRVSKVCLCVRNTGSRAAFIKAVAYSDVQARCLMASTVISLSPSQFVLKERTQEVITVLMKSTQREQSLCQSAKALLATVCLFCGDEVSRQQYRRLLQNKPEAARKVLSENSLLKNIDFNEKFLGEEEITEAYDLPQRPNEAQIFYGNMSKVILSLLGSTSTTNSEESLESLDTLQPTVGHCSETDGANSNVSLDVLPVKGPQGLALKVSDPSLKAAGPTDKQQESWSIQPDQIVLTAPTVNGTSMTRHVHLKNNTSRELSFELSWPAHCLTITPQHGVIEPHCHLQILISPNPSLATKASLLPWCGQIYIQCDGQQKFIKVQIRRDLALDVSATPADRSLSALAPQAATPLLPVVRPHNRSPQPPRAPPTLVEIRNRTVVFPVTPSGETSDAHLEVENGEEEVRWYLSSFAPPYVKGVDGSGDVYRATYTAFRCSTVSGTLGAHQKMQVPITFLPRDRGDYAQFWDLECHPVSDPQQKTGIRFQLCGTGVKSGPAEGPHEGDCSLVKTEAAIKTRKKSDANAVKTGPEEVVRRGVYSPQELYAFPATRVGESSSLKVNIRNNSSATHELTFVNPREPFHIKHSKYSLRSQHYLKLPVQFKPTTAGRHTGLLLVQSETSEGLVIQLTGEAFH